MLNFGLKQKYLILDENTNLYYRSDSVLPTQQPQITKDTQIDYDVIKNVIKQRLEDNLNELKLAKQEKQDIERQKQKLEIREEELATKISELERKLEPLLFFS